VIKYGITNEYQYFKAMTKTGTRLQINELKNELRLLKCVYFEPLNELSILYRGNQLRLIKMEIEQ